jgi:hypothetical protein
MPKKCNEIILNAHYLYLLHEEAKFFSERKKPTNVKIALSRKKAHPWELEIQIVNLPRLIPFGDLTELSASKSSIAARRLVQLDSLLASETASISAILAVS